MTIFDEARDCNEEHGAQATVLQVQLLHAGSDAKGGQHVVMVDAAFIVSPACAHEGTAPIIRNSVGCRLCAYYRLLTRTQFR
jgi:hypothetical protein